jgi:hypothetical protein
LRLVTNPVEAITLCDFVRVLKGENMKKGIITLIAAASIGLLAAGAPAMASGGSGGGGTSTGGGGGGVPAPAPAPVPVPAPAVCGGLTVAIVYNTAGYWQATGTASKVCDPLPIRIEIVDTTPTMPDGCFTGSGTGVLGVHLSSGYFKYGLRKPSNYATGPIWLYGPCAGSSRSVVATMTNSLTGAVIDVASTTWTP